MPLQEEGGGPMRAEKWSLLLTLAGRLADLASTYAAFALNPFAYEQNPFMRALLPAPAAALLVQLAGGFLMWLIPFLVARRPMVPRLLLLVPPLLSWLPIPNNALVALGGEGFLRLPYPSFSP